MEKNWDNAIVTQIRLAIFVASGAGRDNHRDRPFHGLVINDGTAARRIRFSDGTVLNTGPHGVYYLPKGSSYRVENLESGGCWAINFDLLEPWEHPPFCMSFRNHEPVLKLFREAVEAWMRQDTGCNAFLRRTVYGLLVAIQTERQRSYLPGRTEALLAPAMARIAGDFTNSQLSVKKLAALCRVSEAYFRRIFRQCYGCGPKEHIIALRMSYAKKLLQSRQIGVAEVALRCGYPEPCHFSREFVKHTGMSPRSFAIYGDPAAPRQNP